jgi:C4-dicarboxylate-specific signal transduction histidine kinase
VLKFARNEELEKSPGNLGEVIRYARDIAAALAKEKGVTVEIKLGDDLPPLVMASAEMEQVFANLIVNAVQASGPGSSVTVRSAVAADGVQVFVEDRGCGMNRDELDRIFDPFTRLVNKRAAQDLDSVSVTVSSGSTAERSTPRALPARERRCVLSCRLAAADLNAARDVTAERF